MRSEVENKIIGIVWGKMIVKNENDNYFYTDIQMESILTGEHILQKDLIPLEELGTEQMRVILRALDEEA